VGEPAAVSACRARAPARPGRRATTYTSPRLAECCLVQWKPSTRTVSATSSPRVEPRLGHPLGEVGGVHRPLLGWRRRPRVHRGARRRVGVAVATDRHAVDLGTIDRDRARATSPTGPGSPRSPAPRPGEPLPGGRHATRPSAAPASRRAPPRPGPPVGRVPAPSAPRRRRGRARAAGRSRRRRATARRRARCGEGHPGGLVEGSTPSAAADAVTTRSTCASARSRPSAPTRRRSAPGLRGLVGRCAPVRLLGRQHEAVADVAHRPDQVSCSGPSLARRRRTWTSTVRVPPK
jgi:hypothetical protein